jgi:hypothetical protein
MVQLFRLILTFSMFYTDRAFNVVTQCAMVETTQTPKPWLRELDYKYLQFIILIKRESSLGRYVFGSEISYNKAPPRLPGLGC